MVNLKGFKSFREIKHTDKIRPIDVFEHILIIGFAPKFASRSFHLFWPTFGTGAVVDELILLKRKPFESFKSLAKQI